MHQRLRGDPACGWPTPSPASSTAAVSSPRQGAKSRTEAARRGRCEEVWGPVLLALLAANSMALLVHAYYFLPDLDGRPPRARRPVAPPKEDVKAFRRTLSTQLIVRYDAVPPFLERAPGFRHVVHMLPSIPDRRRMLPWVPGVPGDAVRNRTYFLEARERPDEEDRPLYIYNPALLPLDNSRLGDIILSDLGLDSLHGSRGGGEVEPAYVATYRVSNFGNCHGPGWGVPDTYQNYLGLALLDRELNIMRDAEGNALDSVIDLNQALYDVRWSYDPFMRRRPRKPKQYMQDCQLLAARSGISEVKADKLILLCNAYAMPVRLQRGGNATDVGAKSNSETNNKIHFRNTYGSGLQLTALERPNMILYGAKNLHYFEEVGGATTSGAGGGGPHAPPGYLEIWPGGPHEYMPIDFGTYPYVKRSRLNQAEVYVLQSTRNATRPEPGASFRTIEEPKEGKRGPLIERDSGSACCVTILWKDERDDGRGEDRPLLLGFSHRKPRRVLPKRSLYNYVSRVYAFEPHPPFNIVARSGFFCLGFAQSSGNATQSDNEQVWGAAHDQNLSFLGVRFNCPRIHFVTGIAEKVGDEGTAIVSYGVNDCYPRMIEVSKEFLVSLLRPRIEGR
ncbi:hypothetical protein ACHAWF_011313 [Thalassiosira exigua]